MMITYVHEQCFIIFINLYIYVCIYIYIYVSSILLQRMLTHESLLLYYYFY